MINFCMFPLLLLKQQVFFGINIPESDGNRKSWVKFLATPSDLTIDDGLHFWLGTYGGFRFVMGVPPVLIHFLLGFSLTIQLLGYPHDETETCIWSFLQMGWEVLMKNHQRKFSWHTSELRAHVHGGSFHHGNHRGSNTGWWFGTWMDYFYIYWEQSSQLTNIFQRGCEKPPSRIAFGKWKQ